MKSEFTYEVRQRFFEPPNFSMFSDGEEVVVAQCINKDTAQIFAAAYVLVLLNKLLPQPIADIKALNDERVSLTVTDGQYVIGYEEFTAQIISIEPVKKAEEKTTDTTTLVGLARLWGQNEGITFLPKNGEATPDTVMKGYDDMDLAKLLTEWAKEFDALPATADLFEFFEQKVKELCADFNLRQILKPVFDEEKSEIPPDKLAEIRRNVEKEIHQRQTDEEWATAKWEVENHLKFKDESFFAERGTTLQQVLADEDLMDTLITAHYRNVHKYGCDADWSVKEVCDCEPGIPAR